MKFKIYRNWKRILCGVWVALLATSFYVCARSSYRSSIGTEEYAYGCDPFGYLRMAKQIRHAMARGGWPQFKLESTQTRTLINFMEQQNVAVPRWEEVVAPHAHHYFPKSGSVGVQYPPGTGLVLAMFPQGEAVYGLNRLVVFVFGIVAIGALIFALWKQAWASIGLVILALNLGLIVLERIGPATFSINAALVPILLTCLFSLFALRFKNGKLALVCAFIAGLSLGFATLIRLPVLLLLPGFLILIWPGLRELRVKSLPVALVFGVILTGIIPVLVNQQDVAGAWYLPTYANVDAAAPTFERFKSNLSFFLGNGPATLDNWALLYALVGFAGFLLLYSKNGSNRLGLTWKRLALAALSIWLISICYFLTHAITAPHYMIPPIFAAVTLLGFGALSIEGTTTGGKTFNRRSVLSWAALVLILWPGLATANRVWTNRYRGSTPRSAQTRAPILLPAELVDDKAWIWADLMTGSLWYYASKPAFKIQFTDHEVRAMLYRFVYERGERQYLLQDSEQMKQYIAEIERLGGKFEMRGKIEGAPVLLVVWPAGGPMVAQARR